MHQPAAAPPWRDSEATATVLTLAAASAGALAALEAMGAFVALPPAFELQTFTALAAVLKTCPERSRLGLSGSMLAQGLAETLCALTARAAAAVPAPGAAVGGLPGMGALILAAALGSGGNVDLEVGGPMQLGLVFKLRLEQQHAAAPLFAERLLEAAPALLERVVDVVVAGAPWYAAVTAALTGPGSTVGPCVAPLLIGFVRCKECLWGPAVSVLELVPLRALMAADAGSGCRPMARLVPALLALAEATQAVAGALRIPSLELPAEGLRGGMMQLASAAMCMFDDAARALGGAAAALVNDAPGALATLLHLSAAELPLLANGGGDASRFSLFISRHHCRVRLRATRVLGSFCTQGAPAASCAGLAALLAASPELVAALGAAVGATDSERRLACNDAAAAGEVTARRALASTLLEVSADACGADGAPWLRSLAT